MNYSERLHALIPGGAHTYSRGDDQYPANAPQILSHGKGAYVWDPEGNNYLDYGMALRAITVGYAHEAIAQAAYEESLKGNNLTRASLTELQAAELIVDLIPSADMVKFAKNGSTVTTAAIKLARAYTGRKYVVVCAQQPFFSFDDWFIGSTVLQRGIPEEYRALTLKFHYNDIASLEALFAQYPDQIAAVIMEPATTLKPAVLDESNADGTPRTFLHQVQDTCRKNGAVFIIDEMITGFRWHLNGAQTYFGIEPDLSTFGKGMANGFSVAALVGKRDIMNIGGILDEGAERVFLVSTTHGAEMNGLGAFIKTVEVYRELDVVGHLWRFGRKLMDGVNGIAQEYGIGECFYLEGYECSPNYVAKNRDGQVSLELRTLFSQEMLNKGVLMPWLSPAYAHGDDELHITLDAARSALEVYRRALDGDVNDYLVGRAIRPVFRKFN